MSWHEGDGPRAVAPARDAQMGGGDPGFCDKIRPGPALVDPAIWRDVEEWLCGERDLDRDLSWPLCFPCIPVDFQ